MMNGFEDVTLSWNGEDYIVPANKCLMLVAKVEDALSGDTGQQAIGVLLRREGPPYTRLAMAYGSALRYAGADVSDDEVYLSIMSGLSENKVTAVEQTQMAIMALLAVVSPPMGRVLAGTTEKKSPKKKKGAA